MEEGDQNNAFDDQPTIAPGVGANGETDSAQQLPKIAIPTIENYEILNELGRGGMGVVYKARDTKLDRVVALKMILGGKFASEEEIQRFRIEGESAARLDHPGIVPIYEIEEVDGNHFFSMKFVEGDSLLNRFDDYKSDHRAACELVAKIADAVQHAHQRAVLHRDLKPANILIDSEGQPSITDFGLAKRTDGDSELTATGLVMGTPGFMSSEQAAGRKDITAATDVFSLGAILYWTITGEAPFQGETRIQAVMKTIEGEASSIRSLVPNASSDLELICQKAMHKDPLQRYSSAAAMAGDLRAWLDGEPISVRPASAMSVASVWIRKNLRSVLGAVLAGVLCGLVMGTILGFRELMEMAAAERSIQRLGDESKTWVENILWLSSATNHWQWVNFLMVPAVAVCAFLCVLIVKPKNRESNIAAGLTSGFVASAAALLFAGGWGLIGDLSVKSGARDIELLSSAMWLESEGERKLAQKAMIDRYPGLQEMETAQRQRLVRQKILHQQKAGLTPDLWMGVLVAILFVGLPMALTCILSGSMWRQGIRGWQWFGCTWERAAYLLILFLILSLWLSPFRPATWLLLLSPVLLLLALILAVRMSSWYWRILMVPVPFVCMFMIQFDFQAMNGATRRAGTASDNSALRKELIQADRRLKQVDDSLNRYRVAIGWLHVGDEERYKEYCRALNSNFDYAYQPGVASRLTKACMLRPDLQRQEDLDRAWELAEFSSGFDSSVDIKWFQSTRALAELRRGNFEAAHEWNQKCRDGEENIGNGYRFAISQAVDSLAWIGLGDIDNAKRSLGNGRVVHQRARENAIDAGNFFSWHDRLVFRILEKEILAKLE